MCLGARFNFGMDCEKEAWMPVVTMTRPSMVQEAGAVAFLIFLLILCMWCGHEPAKRNDMHLRRGWGFCANADVLQGTKPTQAYASKNGNSRILQEDQRTRRSSKSIVAMQVCSSVRDKRQKMVGWLARPGQKGAV